MRLTVDIDSHDLDAVAGFAARFPAGQFGYVVTPNVDHLIRYHDDAEFRELYADARLVLMDSRFFAYLLRLVRRISLAVCPGSDLTLRLFASVIKPDDRIVVVGGTDAQIQHLRQLYQLTNLVHLNPPMGFIKDAAATEQCLQFVEQHSPFRFCFIAVGSPQQEKVARALKQRGKAAGLALCVGASINFITGDERRAPMWMQRIGMEWLYRLLQDPKRLARRYLVRGPRIFFLLRRLQFHVRQAF